MTCSSGSRRSLGGRHGDPLHEPHHTLCLQLYGAVAQRSIDNLLGGRLVVELVVPMEDQVRCPWVWNGGCEGGEVPVSLGLASIATRNQPGSKSDQRLTIQCVTTFPLDQGIVPAHSINRYAAKVRTSMATAHLHHPDAIDNALPQRSLNPH
jgi:hypothetical protein